MEAYFKILDVYAALDNAYNESLLFEDVSKKELIEFIKKEINLIKIYSLDSITHTKKEKFSESSRPNFELNEK